MDLPHYSGKLVSEDCKAQQAVPEQESPRILPLQLYYCVVACASGEPRMPRQRAQGGDREEKCAVMLVPSTAKIANHCVFCQMTRRDRLTSASVMLWLPPAQHQPPSTRNHSKSIGHLPMALIVHCTAASSAVFTRSRSLMSVSTLLRSCGRCSPQRSSSQPLPGREFAKPLRSALWMYFFTSLWSIAAVTASI